MARQALLGPAVGVLYWAVGLVVVVSSARFSFSLGKKNLASS